MSTPMVPIQTAHDIRMSVYRDSAHDFELSSALEQIADPANFTVITPGRLATANTMVPSVTTLHLGLDGNVTHSTTNFAMNEAAAEVTASIGDSWLAALRQNARKGVLANALISPSSRKDAFYGAHRSGVCLIGGLAVVFNKEEKTISPVEFVSSSLVESIRERNSGAIGSAAMRSAVALAKLRKVNRGKDFDPALVNAVEFMKLAAVQAKPRLSSPAHVSRPLFVTI